VPDERTIRYYTTLGLVDRPAQMRGRTALYTHRHLVQLVAIKRLQAKGLTLAEIQRQLVGASAADLDRLAQLPNLEELAAGAGASSEATRAEQEESASPPREGMEKFWAQTPAPDLSGRREAPGAVSTLQGVPLASDVILVLPLARPIDEDDLETLRIAAAPLLKILQTRRLLCSTSDAV